MAVFIDEKEGRLMKRFLIKNLLECRWDMVEPLPHGRKESRSFLEDGFASEEVLNLLNVNRMESYHFFHDQPGFQKGMNSFKVTEIIIRA